MALKTKMAVKINMVVEINVGGIYYSSDNL